MTPRSPWLSTWQLSSGARWTNCFSLSRGSHLSAGEAQISKMERRATAQAYVLGQRHEFDTCALGERCSAFPPLIVLGLELATAS